MNYASMLNKDAENCATDVIVKNNVQLASNKQQLFAKREGSPVGTPKRNSEHDDSEEKNGKWRLGAYSSSKSNLTNSDDKKMSDWSKQLLEDSLKKNDNMLVDLTSPK